MSAQPNLRRGVAAILTVVICLAAVVAYRSSNAEDRKDGTLVAAADKSDASGSKPLTSLTKGGGWTVFGGTVYRNFVNTVDVNVPDDWNVKAGKNIKWSVDLGSLAYGGPIVADGKIFVGTNNERPRDPDVKGDKGIIMCFRESDGKFLWQAVHNKLEAGRVQDWPREGICSSACVEGKHLYYISNRCELVCAGTEDGKPIWTLDMIKTLGVFPHNLSTSSPMIIGDLLYLITSNGVDEGHINIPAPNAPSFIAVEKKNGKVKWSKNYPGKHIMHGQWSNAVYSDAGSTPHVIFPGGDGWLYGLDLQTGDILWKFDANPKDAVYVLGGKGTKNDFIATPIVYDHKVYIGVGQDPEHEEGIGHLYCIDIAKALENAKKSDDRDVSSELVVKPGMPPKIKPVTKPNPNSAMVWHYGGKAGEDAERNYTFGRTMSTCAVHDGLVYACELAGYLHCLDAKTGKQYWEHSMGSATWSSPYFVDGKVFQGNDAGEVYIFKHGKEKEEPKVINFGAKYVRATPVVANGVLYVLTETPTKLYAIEKK
jgi:outer membrane protein assembly factor BamB